MARRSKQIQEEIAAALAEGTPHPEATVADWKKRISEIQRKARVTSDAHERFMLQQQLNAANDGLRAAQKISAHKPTFLTSVNLFALKEMVLKHGPTFPSRVHAVDAPHLKRTVQAGLVEVEGSQARLTPTGRQVVADELIKDIARESNWKPRENTFVPVESREAILARDIAVHDAKVAQLEEALEKLR